MIDYAQEMRKIRKSNKISQHKLSNISGVAYDTISGIECGRRKGTMLTMVTLFDALGYELVPIKKGE